MEIYPERFNNKTKDQPSPLAASLTPFWPPGYETMALMDRQSRAPVWMRISGDAASEKIFWSSSRTKLRWQR